MGKQFSYEKRVLTVKLYYELHIPVIDIARKLGVQKTIIWRWIKRYEYNGIDGLKVQSTSKRYSKEFKQKIINELLNGESITHLSQKYVLSHSTISDWRLQYEQGGKTMKKKKIISREESEELRKKYRHTKDPVLKELLDRLDWVEMENEALKKLEALTREERQKQK